MFKRFVLHIVGFQIPSDGRHILCVPPYLGPASLFTVFIFVFFLPVVNPMVMEPWVSTFVLIKPFLLLGPWGENEEWTEKFRRVITERLGIATGGWVDLCILYYPVLRCYNNLLSNFLSIILQVVTYVRLQTKENFKLLALKVVTYERWSLTRGSKYSDLTEKLLVFWKTGSWGEVVAYERGGQDQRFNCTSWGCPFFQEFWKKEHMYIFILVCVFRGRNVPRLFTCV